MHRELDFRRGGWCRMHPATMLNFGVALLLFAISVRAADPPAAPGNEALHASEYEFEELLPLPPFVDPPQIPPHVPLDPSNWEVVPDDQSSRLDWWVLGAVTVAGAGMTVVYLIARAKRRWTERGLKSGAWANNRTVPVHCVQCGRPFGDDEVFCIKCGTRRKAETSRDAISGQPELMVRRWPLPAVLLLIVALLLGVWIMWQTDSRHSPVKSQTENSMPTLPSKAPPTALEVPMGEYTGER